MDGVLGFLKGADQSYEGSSLSQRRMAEADLRLADEPLERKTAVLVSILITHFKDGDIF